MAKRAARPHPDTRAIDVRYCPIFLVRDAKITRLSNVPVRFIRNIADIQETADFAKALGSLGAPIEKAWAKTKGFLALTTSAGSLDFKPWPKDKSGSLFSVRVTKSIRAHIRLSRDPTNWIAESIGGHKQMGHGYLARLDGSRNRVLAGRRNPPGDTANRLNRPLGR